MSRVPFFRRTLSRRKMLWRISMGLTVGGDVPCPFCKTEEFIEYDPFGLLYVGNDKEKTREWYFSYIEKLREDIDNKKYFNNEL